MEGLPALQTFDPCDGEPQRRPQRREREETAPHTRRERSQELARIVEGEIIPRLMLVHNEARGPFTEGGCGALLEPETTERFAMLSLGSGADTLLAVVGELLQRGFAMETIYLDLLAPAARRLGAYWDEDRVSFADVTIALGRLQQVVRELSWRGPHTEGAHGAGRSALFAPAPGEQHTFGLVIVEEFFRRAGWRTWTELSGSEAEVAAAARTHAFDVLGFSLSSVEHLDQLAQTLMSVRQVSRNHDIRILVGGRLFLERPELAAEIGADCVAHDARDAVLKAEGALRQLSHR